MLFNTIVSWLTNALPTIGVGLGVIASLYAFFVWLYRKFKKMGIYKLIEKLNYEFSANGGYTTMKDRQDRIYEMVVKIDSRQELTLEHNPMPMFECDKEGTCTNANQAMVDLFGAKNRHELMGRGWIFFVDNEIRKSVEEKFEDAINNSITEFRDTFTILNKATNRYKNVELNLKIKRKKTGNHEPIIMHGAIICKTFPSDEKTI